METQTRIKIMVSLTLLSVLLTSIALHNYTNRDSPCNCNVGLDSSDGTIVKNPPQKKATNEQKATLEKKVGSDTFKRAMAVLRWRGYSAMALFLETNPIEWDANSETIWGVTVFAPPDEAVARVEGEVARVLLRHVAKSITFIDKDFAPTFLEGYVITETKAYRDKDDRYGTYEYNYEVPSHSATELFYRDSKIMFSVYGLDRILPPLTPQQALTGGLDSCFMKF